jgi:hypothetical protein
VVVGFTVIALAAAWSDVDPQYPEDYLRHWNYGPTIRPWEWKLDSWLVPLARHVYQAGAHFRFAVTGPSASKLPMERFSYIENGDAPPDGDWGVLFVDRTGDLRWHAPELKHLTPPGVATSQPIKQRNALER